MSVFLDSTSLEGSKNLTSWDSGPNHAVQFYEDDNFLSTAVSKFLADGLRSNQALLVVATQPHREAFAGCLEDLGFDVEMLQKGDQLVMFDAIKLLSTFMVGTMPDIELFRDGIGGAIEKSVIKYGPKCPRVYGEMVDLLWREGNPKAAIRLEELWNDLAETHTFSLLCAYPMANFHMESHGAHFEEVCRKHTHVIPSETYSTLGTDETRLREISLLQQRARALQTEIEHRKELEKTLRESLAEREELLLREQVARAEAEAANRIKDEFLAVVSHELRTPLNAILGWAHIARTPAVDDSTVRRALEVIHRNGSAQLHVIDDLLDVSRILSGKMLITTEPVDLSEIISASLETVRAAATAKSINWDLQLDHSVSIVTGDRDRLQQIMWNLLSNAIKFTPKQGRIAVRLEYSNSEALISVADNGQGIGPDFLPHVFERFRQGDMGTTRKHGGLGLGLAVVRHLVEAHGGTVSAASEGDGRGAVFSVTLPIFPVSSAIRESVGGANGERLVTLKNIRILVVDDEKDARELFTYILSQAGASVVTKASVNDALEGLSSQRFDVLVADIGMPDRDGYTLMQAVRTHPKSEVRDIRAVAVTSYAARHSRTRAIASGYNEYTTKPVEAGRFAQVVSDLIARRTGVALNNLPCGLQSSLIAP